MLLRLPARLEYKEVGLRAVTIACRRYLRSRGERGTAEEALVHAVVSALGEAFNNVVLHAYGTGAVGPVEVELALEPSCVRLFVRDNGDGFELTDVPSPALAELPESGMGLYIIRAFMDEVAYTRGSPNVLRLEKRL